MKYIVKLTMDDPRLTGPHYIAPPLSGADYVSTEEKAMRYSSLEKAKLLCNFALRAWPVKEAIVMGVEK